MYHINTWNQLEAVWKEVGSNSWSESGSVWNWKSRFVLYINSWNQLEVVWIKLTPGVSLEANSWIQHEVSETGKAVPCSTINS